MANYGNVFKALVIDADASSGVIEVIVPTIAGSENRIAVTTVGRKPIDGVWKVPEIGQVVLVASDDNNLSTPFLVPTYTYDDVLHATDIYGDLEGLIVFQARNDSGINIPANKAVCGQADGGYLVVSAATTADLAKPAIGFAVDAIPPNGYGKIAVSGVLTNFNTSTLAANTNIFLGPSGTVVSTPIGQPYAQIVGKVLSVGTSGSILITIENLAAESSGTFAGTFAGTIYATAGNIGGASAGWIIDSDRLESRGTTKKIVLDGTDGEIYIGTFGTGVYNGASTPFYVNQDGYFSLGNKLTFNPVTNVLDVNGTITADAGNIAGWSILTNRLSSGTGASTVSLASSGGTSIYAGSSSPSAAPFRVTNTGILTASGVDLSGRLVATSGSIGGWNITSASISSGGATPIVLDSSGKITVGNPNWANTANGFYVDNTGKFSLGSKLTWDTSTLSVNGNITSVSGVIGGWNIDNNRLYAGASSTYIELSSSELVEYRTWAGHPTASSAPFRVKRDGSLISTSGSIGGFLISATSITAGTGSSAVGLQSTGTYPIWAGNPDPFVAPFSARYDGYITASSVSVLNFYNTGGSLPAIIQGRFEVDGGKVALGRQIGTGASSSGLYINKTVGTTNDPLWDNYWYSSGRFRVGSPTGYMTFDGSGSLVVSGSITGSSVSGSLITGGSVTGALVTGASLSGGQISIGSNFNVSNTGVITASGASINGVINASSGTFSGTITAASITGSSINAANISGGTVSGALITAGSVSGNTIIGGVITGSSVSGVSVTGASVTGAYVSGGSVDIGTNPSVSFHIDSQGNVWTGASTGTVARDSAPFRLYNDGSIDIGGNDATSLHINALGNVYAGAPKTDPSQAPSAIPISSITGLSGSQITITTASAHGFLVGHKVTGSLITSNPVNSLNFVDYVVTGASTTSFTVANPTSASVIAALQIPFTTTVIYQTAAPHNFRTGASVVVSGITGGSAGSYSGTFVIQSIGTVDTFLVNNPVTGAPTLSSARAVMSTTYTSSTGLVRRIPPLHITASDGSVRASYVVASDKVSGSSNHLNLNNVLRLTSNITIGNQTLYATDSLSSYDEGFNFSLSAANGFNARVDTTTAIQINSSGYYSILPVTAGGITTTGQFIKYGGVPLDVGSGSATAQWDSGASGGALRYTSGSSRRYKNYIYPIDTSEVDPRSLLNLPVVKFKYNDGYLSESDCRVDKFIPGFIAEDVLSIYPIACDLNSSGIPETWNERIILPPMLKLIQDLYEEIDVLTARVTILEGGN